MTTARSTHQALTARNATGLAAEIADLFQNLAKALLDPYRPEQHYMRGPGPKWHAKHAPAPVAPRASAMPALVLVHVRH